jgi:PDZ domain
VNFNQGTDLTYDFGSARLDGPEVERLINGSDPNWHLNVAGESLGGVPVTRFDLVGLCRKPGVGNSLCPVHAIYWVGREADKPVCFQESLSNLADHTWIFSRRQGFDQMGFPASWNIASADGHGVTRIETVSLQSFDIHPQFRDEQVFAPTFPTNYVVLEPTSQTSIPNQAMGAKLLSANRAGVGIQLRTDPQSREVKIAMVQPDSAASRAGLQPGSIVSKIDGFSTAGMNSRKCVILMRGQLGTKITIDVITPDKSATNSIELTRDVVY